MTPAAAAPQAVRALVVWLLSIACALAAGWWIAKEGGKELIAGVRGPAVPASKDLPALPSPRPLTPQEQQWARTAWSYFEQNVDRQTGLAHSVAGFPSATMWDTASYLLALIAAQDLGLIEKRSFDIRMAKALVSLERMPLYGGMLPNKSYNAVTLEMTDHENKPSPSGIGWSAIDIGRLLVPLNVVAWRHPVHTPAVRRLLARLETSDLVRDGQLVGMQSGTAGAPQALQEGRLGYEQYAARGFRLVGIDAEAASDWRNHLQLVKVEGVRVCADDRDPQRFGAQNTVLSEPYILWGLGFGWTSAARECAWRAYRAQEARFRKTGVPTLSVKAAFGWHALLRNEYTRQLIAKVAGLHEPDKGWYAGLYEVGGKPNKAMAANTNAVVLESLAYIAQGPLLRYREGKPPGRR